MFLLCPCFAGQCGLTPKDMPQLTGVNPGSLGASRPLQIFGWGVVGLHGILFITSYTVYEYEIRMLSKVVTFLKSKNLYIIK